MLDNGISAVLLKHKFLGVSLYNNGTLIQRSVYENHVRFKKFPGISRQFVKAFKKI